MRSLNTKLDISETFHFRRYLRQQRLLLVASSVVLLQDLHV